MKNIIQTAISVYFHKCLAVLVAMGQMVSQLGSVFTIDYPELYKQVLRWLGIINLDLLQLSPLICSVDYNFCTTSQIEHTTTPAAPRPPRLRSACI